MISYGTAGRFAIFTIREIGIELAHGILHTHGIGA